MKMRMSILLAISVAILLASCGAVYPIGEPDESSNNAEQTNGLSLSVVDLNDLAAVRTTYLEPIAAGRNWYYSWGNVSKIDADDFIRICTDINYLGLPRDVEGVYENVEQPAASVETAIQERFDVSSEHLKTSQYYNAENDTYFLYAGGNSGWYPVALSAKQDGSVIVIEVGINYPLPVPDEKAAGMVVSTIEGDGVAIPAGTLTIKLSENKQPQYLSYLLYDEDFWDEYK